MLNKDEVKQAFDEALSNSSDLCCIDKVFFEDPVIWEQDGKTVLSIIFSTKKNRDKTYSTSNIINEKEAQNLVSFISEFFEYSLYYLHHTKRVLCLPKTK
jgi:hypothetical protein